MADRQLKVALVGCGQIADAHLQEIARVPIARAVAVCDRQIDLARQAAARFGVPGVYDDLDNMVQEVHPDVVHVATPPHTHAPIAKALTSAGIHVYMEKPFALDAQEAASILDAARAAGRLVCVGHDQLYDPAWLDVRRRFARGELGDVVHVDSHLGYNLAGPFGKVVAGDPDHWVRQLPGGLLQNTISHPLYKVTDFLLDEEPQVWATWFGAELLGGVPTELRVMLRGRQTTGSLVFSGRYCPMQRLTTVLGSRQSLEVDLDGQVVRLRRAGALPGALAKLEVPLRHLADSTRTTLANSWRFLRGRIHYFDGMRTLFELFYRAILDGTPSPIAPAEILRVTRIMDRIFEACRSQGGGGAEGAMAGAHVPVVAASHRELVASRR